MKISQPTPDNLRKAAIILRDGGIVAFPTETVYGLGADATSQSAVRKIFAAKGRPATNPLIVHVHSVESARACAKKWNDRADALVRAFWPGPLAIVLEKNPKIVPEVTAHLSTVALRMPNHPAALELLKAFAGPVAAPSANRSNHISPTLAAHVLADLGDKVDFILNGGACTVGIESTVLDISGHSPRILRPGGIAQAQIEKIIGRVELFHGKQEIHQPASSPGQHERHYSPITPAFRIASVSEITSPAKRIAVLTISREEMSGIARFQMPATPADYAARLYAALHEADVLELAAIYIELPPDTAPWRAVRDRIIRATRATEGGECF